jgi:putative inorganic carbon (hco3(-)) transporter
MEPGASAADRHHPAWRASRRHILIGAALALLAALIAVAPPKWVLAGLGGVALAVLICIRPAIGLIAVAFSIPFGDLVTLPGGANLVDVLVLLTVAGWLARSIAERRIVFRRPPLTWALLAFVWCLALSLTQARSWREGLPEWLKWAEFAAIYLVSTQILDEENAWWVVGALFAGGLIEALLGANQFLHQVGPEAFIFQGRFMRAYGTFRQPNPYAGYLGYLAPVAASLAMVGLGRWLAQRKGTDLLRGLIFAGVAAALIAGIIMSWSRGGWFGLIAGLLAVVALRSRRTAAVTLIVAILLSLVVVVSGINALPGPIGARLNDLGSYLIGPDPAQTEITDANFAVLERLAHWQAGQQMFDDHPWLGVGVGNYGTAYATYAPPHWYDSLGHAHNVFVNFLAETGIFGFAAFAFFWLAAGWLAWRIASRSHGYRAALAIGVLGAWLALSVHSMFDNLFVAHMQLQLALLLGALVIVEKTMRPETPSAASTRQL